MNIERSQTLEPLFAVVLVEPAQQMQVGDRFRETDGPLIDGSITDATASGLPVDKNASPAAGLVPSIPTAVSDEQNIVRRYV